MDMPEKIRIIAIEIVEDLEFSENFSPKIKEKYPEIMQEVREYLKENYE